MKLFGGGAHGGKHNKQPLTKAQKTKRMIIVILAVIVAVIAVVSAAVATMMRPPTTAVSSSSGIKPEKNDATILDTENGDEMVLDEGDELDIDMGNRREGVYTVLVAATDEDGTRTDAIMVATLDTVNDTVSVINIPRDLMSNVSRVGASKKINAAYGTSKGIEQTKIEVKKALGYTPDKYVVVSFDAIAEIIDKLGGVDYEVPWRMKYDDPTQNLHIDFQPGMTHMDGQAAVEFMRWRKNNSGVSTGVSGYTGGDEERIKKDQDFLKYLAGQVFTLKNVPKIPSFAQTVFKNVETDLTAGEILWLAWQLYDVKNENINMMTLPGYGAMSYAGTGTMYSFYFPYKSQTLEMVNTYLNPYEKDITTIDVITSPTTGSGSKSSSSGSSSSSSGSGGSSGSGSSGGDAADPETDVTTTPDTAVTEPEGAEPPDETAPPADTDEGGGTDEGSAPAGQETVTAPVFPEGMFAPGDEPVFEPAPSADDPEA